MGHPRYTKEEIARRGEALYQERLRATVEPGNHGKYLVIDIETGEYELDSDELAAVKRALAKHPDPALYIMRVGSSVATNMGGWLPDDRP